jgi:hypothetical protein
MLGLCCSDKDSMCVAMLSPACCTRSGAHNFDGTRFAGSTAAVCVLALARMWQTPCASYACCVAAVSASQLA